MLVQMFGARGDLGGTQKRPLVGAIRLSIRDEQSRVHVVQGLGGVWIPF